MNTVLFSGNENVTMSSREIAELTGKHHRNVTADIRNMMEQLEIDVLEFQHIYFDSMNRKQTEYNLDRIHVECLLTGYSVPLRMKVLKRLAELEKKDKTDAPALPNFSNPVEAARAWANEVEAKMLALEESSVKTELIGKLDEKIERDAPLVDYANDVHVSVNAQSFSDAAKSLGVGRNDLYAFCRAKKLLMDHPNRNVPYQHHINAGLFEVKQNTFTDFSGNVRIQNTTLVTGKGHQKLHKMLRDL